MNFTHFFLFLKMWLLRRFKLYMKLKLLYFHWSALVYTFFFLIEMQLIYNIVFIFIFLIISHIVKPEMFW